VISYPELACAVNILWRGTVEGTVIDVANAVKLMEVAKGDIEGGEGGIGLWWW